MMTGLETEACKLEEPCTTDPTPLWNKFPQTDRKQHSTKLHSHKTCFHATDAASPQPPAGKQMMSTATPGWGGCSAEPQRIPHSCSHHVLLQLSPATELKPAPLHFKNSTAYWNLRLQTSTQQAMPLQALPGRN